MTNKIAILVTTMLRDELLDTCIDAMLEHLPENSTIFIADQSPKMTLDKKLHIFNKYADKPVCYYKLDYNCGLSYARNYLVERAFEHECKYCVLAADNMIFNEKTENLDSYIPVLEGSKPKDLVGFHLAGPLIYWVGWLGLKPGQFFTLDFIDRSAVKPGRANWFDCNIVHNFFLATTQSLRKVKWDDNLKQAEHEDFFYRYAKAGYKCVWTPDVSCDYIIDRTEDFDQVRKNNRKEGLATLYQKYKIKMWISRSNEKNGLYGVIKKDCA